MYSNNIMNNISFLIKCDHFAKHPNIPNLGYNKEILDVIER